MSDVRGAVSAAASPKGIQGFCTHALVDLVGKHLRTVGLDGKKDGIGFVPGTGCDVKYVELKGGRATISNIHVPSVTQRQGGEFEVTINADVEAAYDTWTEDGRKQHWDPSGQPFWTSFHDTFGDFSFSCKPIKLTVSAKLSADQHKTKVDVLKCASDVQVRNLSIHLPKNSLFSGNWKSVQDKIDDAFKDRIAKSASDFEGPVKDLLSHLFDSIPDSGKLTDDITFQFPAEEILFPNDSGIAARTTGGVLYKTTRYPGDLPVTPVPGIPDKDIAVFVHEYEFNALLWAFHTAGDLHLRITKDMIPDPAELTTDYYKDVPGLKWLAEDYPGCDLVVYVKTLEAPTAAIKKSGVHDAVKYDCIVNVLTGGKEEFLIEVNIDEQDTLNGFGIASAGNLQRLTFRFELDESNPTVVRSKKPIDPVAFAMFWKFIVRPAYSQTMDKVGQTGVPLPAVIGFTFCDTTIMPRDGYMAIVTNIGERG